MASNTFHRQCLQRCCRVCGAWFNKNSQQSLCSDHQAAILHFFGVNTAEDNTEWSPANICYNSCLSKRKKYHSHTHYTNNTDVITSWKAHDGDECETCAFFIKRSKGGKRKLSTKGRGRPSKLSKTSPENRQLPLSPTRTTIAELLSVSNEQPLSKTEEQLATKLLRRKFSTERSSTITLATGGTVGRICFFPLFLQWYILNGTGLRMSGVHINLKIRGDFWEGMRDHGLLCKHSCKHFAIETEMCFLENHLLSPPPPLSPELQIARLLF